MVERDEKTKKLGKRFVFRAIKVLLKSFIFYVLYLFVWSFFSQFENYIPSLHQTVENFVIVYILLVVFGDLVSDTIFQYFFDVAKAFFVVGYLILALNGGIINLTYMDIVLTVDLRLFLMAAVLLSLLGLARSILQAINYANKKADLALAASL
ncbi:MAG: hypothetical protein QXL54_03720 [Candidatus Bathyarchaeia archaeon]